MSDITLDDGLTNWVKSVEEKTSGMSTLDKAEIANAGAKVFEKKLREETNTKHRSKHDDKVYGHAADNIGRYQPKDGADGIRLGTYIVGWNNKYNAENMRYVNDGTSKLVGDHFITNLQHDPKTQSDILRAEKSEWERRTKNKGDD